ALGHGGGAGAPGARLRRGHRHPAELAGRPESAHGFLTAARLSAIRRPMLDASARRETRWQPAIAWGTGSFLLGLLLSLIGMLQKPDWLEFRFLETVLVLAGVLLA